MCPVEWDDDKKTGIVTDEIFPRWGERETEFLWQKWI